MSDEADEVRRALRDLFERRARGDVRDKDFERRLEELSVELSRMVARANLPPGETILAEHHLVHSHFKLTQSFLKEPEQQTASFFASEHRLVRVRAILLPGRPVSLDASDDTVVDGLAYEDIQKISVRRQRRWGEVAVAVAVVLLALALGKALAVTGPMLVILGAAGVLHGTLFPTRSIEIVGRADASVPPFEIHGVRRRGARKLMAMVRVAVAREAAP